MKLIICNTYNEVSEKLATEVIDRMSERSNPLLCTASGDSPTGLYKELVNRVNSGTLDISTWKFVGLDEWVGMDGTDEGSCRYYIDQHLFKPLHIAESRICFFNGKANDLKEECNKVNEFISGNDGIDTAILGVGMNGHVGLNEPGVSPDLYAHVMKVDRVTQDVGQKYFNRKMELKLGITLGIAALMEVRYPFIITSGKHKAAIMQKVLEEEISNKLPASLLRRHPSLKVYLDRDAASLLQSNK